MRVSEDWERRAKLERFIESQRARPQARPMPTASMSVNRVLKPLAGKGKRRGSSALALAGIWTEIMGPRWSKISAPVRYRGSKDGRTLVISAPGPAAALILAASGQIIARINAHYGSDYVQSLQVVQAKAAAPVQAPARRGLTPGEEDALRDGLDTVENPRLREALGKLGREVLRNSE